MIWLVLAIKPVGKPRVRFPAIVTVCTPPHPAATAIVEASVRAQGAAAGLLVLQGSCMVPITADCLVCGDRARQADDRSASGGADGDLTRRTADAGNCAAAALIEQARIGGSRVDNRDAGICRDGERGSATTRATNKLRSWPQRL